MGRGVAGSLSRACITYASSRTSCWLEAEQTRLVSFSCFDLDIGFLVKVALLVCTPLYIPGIQSVLLPYLYRSYRSLQVSSPRCRLDAWLSHVARLPRWRRCFRGFEGQWGPRWATAAVAFADHLGQEECVDLPPEIFLSVWLPLPGFPLDCEAV